MIHAVSLEEDPECARALAFSVSRLRDGALRTEHADLELTAVVEAGTELITDEGNPESDKHEIYRFQIEIMEEQHIKVLTTSDLKQLAATARKELTT